MLPYLSTMGSGKMMNYRDLIFVNDSDVNYSNQHCVSREGRAQSYATNAPPSFSLRVFCCSAAHRAHASTEGVSSFVDISVAGFSMRDEIVAFEKLLSHPETPEAAIIGGAKLSTKISVLLSLLPKVDKLLIGGAMVFTFYRAMDLDIGESLHEESQVRRTAADLGPQIPE